MADARSRRLAAHVLRRDGEAEDVAQEAFLRAFRSLPRFAGQGTFFAWLSRIVIRLCLDRQRLARWRRETPSDEEDLTPAPTVTGVETRLLVAALLDRLSPPMRAALVLREMEGLEYAEIAEILHIPVGTVRSRLNAARAQFRALWPNALEEESHV